MEKQKAASVDKRKARREFEVAPVKQDEVPPSFGALFYGLFFGWEGNPKLIRLRRKKGTLILTSLLEDPEE